MSILNEESPDDTWNLLVNTITEVATEAYPPGEQRENEYRELARRRRKLLKDRAEQRQQLRGADDDTAATLKLELVMTTRRARKTRQQAVKDRSARLLQEIW